jgi:hypothetical protein
MGGWRSKRENCRSAIERRIRPAAERPGVHPRRRCHLDTACKNTPSSAQKFEEALLVSQLRTSVLSIQICSAS